MIPSNRYGPRDSLSLLLILICYLIPPCCHSPLFFLACFLVLTRRESQRSMVPFQFVRDSWLREVGEERDVVPSTVLL